jgi:hypothetical protein
LALTKLANVSLDDLRLHSRLHLGRQTTQQNIATASVLAT